MKKIYTFLTLIALAVLSFGCAKETDIAKDEVLSQDALAQPGDEAIFTVILNVPESPDTKTVLGSKNGSSYPVKWSSGDGEYLSLNGTVAASSKKNSDTQYKASFKPASGLSVYNFLYRGDAGHDNQVSFPSTQNYVSGGFDPAAMPMYASSASRSENVTFSHLASLLKFSLTGSKKIDSVTLSARESLSGTFTIGKTGDLLNGSLTPASSGAALVYSFGSHIQLSSEPFVFYVAIPAGTYEDGITLDIVDNSSGHMTLYVMTEVDKQTIAAGRVREFATVDYAPATELNLKQIYNDATFNEFVAAVAAGNTTLNARLTQNAATLTLSASTVSAFESIDDYKGTFDGNGKAIAGLTKPLFNNLRGVVKNLTLNSAISETSAGNYELGIFARRVTPSSEIDDIAGLQNCTANGSLTYTPSSALSSSPCIGGLVGNNKGGTFVNCTNNATVTFGDNSSVTHSGDIQPSIAGVVGRTQKGGDFTTQGDISNCTNTGTVSCAEQFGGNIMIGGVVGYQVEKAESISGCTNSGTVIAKASCSTDKVLHIGGVIGMGKGTIESCSNLSGGVVTTEACSVGTYLCQGGVIGRMNRENGTYSGLSNAGTVNVAATGASTARLIGGVVGRCNEGAAITEFTNSGNINYTAVDSNETWIGGIVACSTNHALTSCNSTGGTLTYSGATTDGALYVGGVVGYSTKDITSCSNAMTLNITGTMSCTNNTYKGFGGIAGHVNGANILVTNCTNSGSINYGQTVTDEGQTYVGGLIGVLSKGEISGGGNSGTFTFSGQNTKRSPSIGGIVGRVMSNDTESGYALSNNVTNSGSIILNSSVSSSQYMYVGGLAGQIAAGNILGTNSGSITVTEVHASMMALGGLVGYLAGGAITSGSANTATGDISIVNWVSTYHSYVGGIVGMSSGGSTPAAGGGTIAGVSNAGDITMGAGCSIPRSNFIGGIAGYAGNTVSSSGNSGNIVNNYSQSANASGGSASVKDLCIGGVAGVTVADLSSCYNTGDVTNNGSTYDVEINVGGVVGMCFGNLTSCSNGTASLAGGTISNTANSGTSTIQDLQVGGVIANSKADGFTHTSCFNKGTVTNSGAGNTLSVGGVTAWSTKATYVGCYNLGAVSNTGSATNGGGEVPGVRLGGLVGCASSANTLTGTSGEYNYNNGAVTENSSSTHIAVSGICAYSDNTSTDFTYAANHSDGDITVSGGNKDQLWAGGVLACGKSATVDYASNAGDIVFDKVTVDQLWCGGIIGKWLDTATLTIQYCANSGAIKTKTQSWDNTKDLMPRSYSCPYSYIGGISGGGNDNNGKTYSNCTNSGKIDIYSPSKYRIGGITTIAKIAPQNCTVKASIRFKRNKAIFQEEGQSQGTTGDSYVGGIVGYADLTSFSGLLFKGSIDTRSNNATKAAGIVAYQSGSKSVTFTDCKIGGSFKAAASDNNMVGLFEQGTNNTSRTYTFTNCVIETGTVWNGDTEITINSSSDVTIKMCAGPNCKLASSSSLPTVEAVTWPSIP